MVHTGQRQRCGRGHRRAHHALTYALAITPVADDQTLVTAVQAGDRVALDTLLRRHHDRLWRLCRRVVGDDADAQDALQEALVAIARGLRRFDGRSSFSTWSYRVATNACLDELRRRRRRPVPEGLGATDADEGRGGRDARHLGRVDALDRADGRAVVGGGTTDGDRAVEAVAERLEIDAALDRLPHDFRVSVVLRDVCDLDYAEIARVLDIPAGTVRSRIARGRALLSTMLGNPIPPSDRPSTHR